MKQDKLINRLNRVSGQIEGLKRQVEAGTDEDCLKMLQQLKASINALKKFGEAYVAEYLENCMQKGKSENEIKENLNAVISGAFFL